MGLASEVGVPTAEMIKSRRRKPNNYSPVISTALLFVLSKHLWFTHAPVVELTVDGELIGVPLFIFRTSSSGLEAAGDVATLLTGLGFRLMTGMAAAEVVGNGAASRLLRMVVVVELVEGHWERAVSERETDFSGSGAET